MKEFRTEKSIYRLCFCTVWSNVDLLPSITVYFWHDWMIEICFLFWSLSVWQEKIQ